MRASNSAASAALRRPIAWARRSSDSPLGASRVNRTGVPSASSASIERTLSTVMPYRIDRAPALLFPAIPDTCPGTEVGQQCLRTKLLCAVFTSVSIS